MRSIHLALTLIIFSSALLYSNEAHATRVELQGQDAKVVELALLRIAAPVSWKENQDTLTVHTKNLACEQDITTGETKCVHDMDSKEGSILKRFLRKKEGSIMATLEIKPAYARLFMDDAMRSNIPYFEVDGKRYLSVQQISCLDKIPSTTVFGEAMNNRDVQNCSMKMNLRDMPDMGKLMKVKIAGTTTGPDLTPTNP